MLVVKIELWPGGDASRSEIIGTLTVANESRLEDVSNYSYCLFKSDQTERLRWEVARGTVRAHRRSDGAWELVRRVLVQLHRRRAS